MEKRHLYIISDLHLGGAAPDETANGIGFQMCPAESRQRLASFIHWVTRSHQDEIAELVINGDFVDFLAEESATSSKKKMKFEDFTFDPADAVDKFKNIVRRTDCGAPEGKRVFEALRSFLHKGHRLTLLLGNHDIELSLPAVRHTLIKELTEGRPAQIEFLYDGEAYECGDLLIEHGNRYDGWNAIPYGAIRAYRSLLSRGEPNDFRLLSPPGSRLVAEIMNPIKSRYRFIDLLKPENEALIPLLAALEPDVVDLLDGYVPVKTIARLWAEQSAIQPTAGRVPFSETYRASRISQTTALRRQQGRGRTRRRGGSSLEAGTFAENLLGDTVQEETIRKSHELLEKAKVEWLGGRVPKTDTQIASRINRWLKSGRSFWRILRLRGAERKGRMAKLREAFIEYRDALESSFDLQTEAPIYYEAAVRLAAGRRVVVFGHTHLPKCTKLKAGGWYLNSGTWCPTIRLSEKFYDSARPVEEVLPELEAFVQDLKHNRTGKWCTLQTTFVKVTMMGDQVRAELNEFLAKDSIKCLGFTDGT